MSYCAEIVQKSAFSNKAVPRQLKLLPVGPQYFGLLRQS